MGKRKFKTESNNAQQDKHPIKKLKPKLSDNQKQPIRGSKCGYHGLLFQLKLLMLFLWRAKENNYEYFRLATEVKEAEKFDDVVLQYKRKSENRWKCRLLQAKHKLADIKTDIQENDLLCVKNADFSLQKYFHSYMKIKRRIEDKDPAFAESEIEDLIICANYDFSNDLKEHFVENKKIKDDNILNLSNNNAKTSEKIAIYCLKDPEHNNPIAEQLKIVIEETSEFYKLVEELGDAISNKKRIDNIWRFKKYSHELFKKIFKKGKNNKYYIHFLFKEGENNKYYSDFTETQDEVKEFKQALLREILFRKIDWEVKIPSEFNKLKVDDCKTRLLTADYKKLNDLAESLADRVKTKTQLTKDEYYFALDQELIKATDSTGEVTKEEQLINLNKSFILRKGDNSSQLSSSSKAYGRNFLEKLINLEEIVKNLPADQIDEFKQIELNISNKLIRKYDQQVAKHAGIKVERLPPVYRESGVVEFFNKLMFVLNYPNHEKISAFLEDDVKNKFKILDSRAFDSIYQTKLEKWMAGKVGTTLTKDNAELLFSDIVSKLDLYTISGFNKSYFTTVCSDYKFTNCNTILEFLKHENAQVVNLDFKNLNLGCIRVVQMCRDLKKQDKHGIEKYTYEFGYVFLKLSQCIDHTKFFDEIKNWIGQSDFCNLIVVECDTLWDDVKFENFFNELLGILKQRSSKKIILIAENDSNLYDKFVNELGSDKCQNDSFNTTFNDLDDTSKKKLMNNGMVVFQGEQVTLRSLLTEYGKDEIYNELVDAELLYKLIDKKYIEIGAKRPHICNLDSIHFSTYEEIGQEKIKNNISDLFTISGASENNELIAQLKIKGECVYKFAERPSNTENVKAIILNGKDEEENLDQFKEICKEYYDKKPIHFIEWKNNKLIWKRSFNKTFYMSRKLYHVVINKALLKDMLNETSSAKEEKKNLFVISNINESQLKEHYYIDISKYSETSNVQNQVKKHAIILTKENNEKCFEDLCAPEKELLLYYNIHWLHNEKQKSTKQKNEHLCTDEKELLPECYNVHWLENETYNLVWRRKEGDISQIRKLKNKDSEICIEEFNDIFGAEKVIVIAGDPGMGKSTTLTNFLKDKRKHEWIIKLNLIDLKDQLKNCSGISDLDNIINILFSKINIGKKVKLADKWLNYYITKLGNITLLFDGFDEICNENQETLIKILYSLKYSQAKMVITARLSAKDKLEDALSVFSYTFQPFSKQEQKDFLSMFWRESYKFEEEKKMELTDEGVSKIFEKFHENIKDEKYKLLGIPLLLRIFAEGNQRIVKQDKLKFLEYVRKQSLLDLYQTFVNRKYGIYMKEKTTLENAPHFAIDATTKAANRDHQFLAFNTLFSKAKQAEKILDKLNLPSEVEISELKLFGIIQSVDSKGDYEFIHRTFAEYFAASLLVNTLKTENVNSQYRPGCQFLLREIFKHRNEIIFEFIKNMVQTEKDDLKREWKSIEDCELCKDIETVISYRYFPQPPIPDSDAGIDVISDSALEKSLHELQNEVSDVIDSQSWYNAYDVNRLNCFSNLFKKLFRETDIDQVVTTLEFLAKHNNRSNFYGISANEIFNKKDNIYKAFRHCLSLAKQENITNMENKFKDAFNEMITNFDEFKNKLRNYPPENNLTNYIRQLMEEESTDGLKYRCLFIEFFHENLKTDIIENIDELYNGASGDFVLNTGIKIAFYFKTLTPNMLQKFNHAVDLVTNYYPIDDFYLSCQIIFKPDGSKVIINFINPMLDIINKENLPHVDRSTFLNMILCYTHYAINYNEEYLFTGCHIKSALTFVNSLLVENQELEKCHKYVFLLRKLGLKLIKIDYKLLILDPVTELSGEVSIDAQLLLRNFKVFKRSFLSNSFTL